MGRYIIVDMFVLHILLLNMRYYLVNEFADSHMLLFVICPAAVCIIARKSFLFDRNVFSLFACFIIKIIGQRYEALLIFQRIMLHRMRGKYLDNSFSTNTRHK